VELPIDDSPRHPPNPKNEEKSPWYGEGRIVGNSFVEDNYQMEFVRPSKKDDEDDDDSEDPDDSEEEDGDDGFAWSVLKDLEGE
jgi:hypothetical protein